MSDQDFVTILAGLVGRMEHQAACVSGSASDADEVLRAAERALLKQLA